MKFRSIDRLSLKMGLGISALLLAALALAFGLLHRQYWNQVLDNARRHALAETQLVQAALEHQMLRNDRSLLREMIDDFAGQVKFERLLILDRQGRVAFSSDPGIRSSHFEFTSPTCQVCHRLPPDQRAQTTTLEMDSGAVLRCVRPIENQRRCHGCHAAEHRLNGVLIADVSLEEVRQRLEQGTLQMALGMAGLGIFLLGGLGLFFRRMVMKRLLDFEAAARSIASGQLGRRIPVKGGDALGRLESRFNDMAEAVEQLVDQVQQQRRELENIINGIDDGIVVLDSKQRVVTANRAFFKRLARPPSELLGRPCRGQQEGHCSGEQPCLARVCLERGQAQVAIRMRRQGEQTFYEEVHASPIAGADGTAWLCVEVWRDITERRSAEARLAGYQRLASLSLLGSGFAHEINTPLATISMCLERLQQTATGTDDRENLQLARQQIERCSAITEQFLSLARGSQPEREWFLLEQELKRVVDLAGSTARLAGVKLELVADERCRVLASPDAVRQVLLNLVINAIQASNHGDTVVVRCLADAGGGHRVEVRDQGRGLSSADRERIFEPFYSGRPEGCGLGLFISLQLARQWGGEIVTGDQQPRGTIMTVTFPRREEDHG